MKKNKDKRIVITGIGPISSIGIGKNDFWNGILESKTNVELEKITVDDILWHEFYTSKIKHFDVSNFGIDRDRLNDIKEWKEGEEIVDLNYLIAAIKLALDDSNIDYAQKDNNIALVLAHENLGLMPFGYKVSNIAYDMLVGKKKSDISRRDFMDRFYKSFLKSGYDIQTFADLFHVARVFNVSEYSLFINNACASGLYAFEAASQIINNNQAKTVVVAASDCSDVYKYIWFKELGIYSDDGRIRPFCKDANGIVFGDGGIGIVLEDMATAEQRNAPIYAEYLGGGFDLEGWKITMPQLGSDSYQKAIKKAFKHAEITNENVDLICPHGTGCNVIDYYEATAITDIFGKFPKKPIITAFKPYIGHTLGASALLETALLVLALKTGIIPKTLNYDNPDSKFNITLLAKQINMKPSIVAKICSAFAGFNAAAIFRRVD
ncbi:MAG: beta-ketoacyl synthase N-terminal-like domain-containing protein [Candidatus Omnitrophica bacterium]|nr:beta-ketoacyl synthase N-terminal-like domain-containing protein [Candidatus Omnitrophota bacterium]